MKVMMRLVMIGVVVCVVAVVSVVVLRNQIIKFVLTRGIKATTGVGMSVDKMRIGLLKPSVDIRGLQLHNPRGYPEPLMMDVPQATIELNAGDLFKGKVHIESLILELSQFNVVKNTKGQVNVNALKPVKEGGKTKERDERRRQVEAKKKGAPMKFQIDYLKYSIGKGVYTDHTAEPVKVQEFPLNITREYRDIQDPAFLISMIVTEVVARTAIARIGRIDVSGAQLTVGDTFKLGGESMGGGVQKIFDGIKDIFN